MTTLAEYTIETEHGYERHRASIMEARNGAEDHWFVFGTEEGLEAVIPFDTAEFRTRPSDDSSIMSIEFQRKVGSRRRRTVKAGQVEGGRLDWGDEIVDTLAAIRDGEFCSRSDCDRPAHLTGELQPNICRSHAEAMTTTDPGYVVNEDGEV